MNDMFHTTGNAYRKANKRRAFFERQLMLEAPRILSGMDRCPVSVSRGCLDREYWAWATKDFANADLQRGLLVLSYLYHTEFDGNRFYRHPALLAWICLGIQFYIDNQHRNGTFDHLYVHENSWMATAFTLVDLLSALSLLRDEIDVELAGAWSEALRRAGQHLLRFDESHGFISNHQAGAAAGLMGLAREFEDDRFEKRAWELMDGVYARQSREGWFYEYTGPDPGYETLGLHYQALFYRAAGGSRRVIAAVRKAIDFLAHFIHPDGSIGGDYGSRACPHFFPGGLEVFSHEIPMAESIAAAGVGGLARGYSSGLADVDVRNAIPLATSCVLALQALDEQAPKNRATENPPLPWEGSFERYWPEAGFFIRSDENSYQIVGGSKGGVLKVFDKPSGLLSFSSAGYAGQLQDGRSVTTLMWNGNSQMDVTEIDPDTAIMSISPKREIVIRTPFFEFNPARVMTPWKFLLFRLFNLSFGRFRRVNSFVREKVIVRRFITPARKTRINLLRRMTLGADNILINDYISGSDAESLRQLTEYGYLSSVYMASAKYFRWQDLSHTWASKNLIRGQKGRSAKATAFERIVELERPLGDSVYMGSADDCH